MRRALGVPQGALHGALQDCLSIPRLFIKAYGQAQHTKYDAILGNSLIKAMHRAPKKVPTYNLACSNKQPSFGVEFG